MGELLGGSVGATSAPGDGSTFWLRLRAESWLEAGGALSGGGGGASSSGADSSELATDAVDMARVAGSSLLGSTMRQRRVSRMRSSPQQAQQASVRRGDCVMDDARVALVAQPRRHSLDGWAQAARHSLGAPAAGGVPTAAQRRASTDCRRSFASAPPQAGSLAASLAAVASAHISGTCDVGAAAAAAAAGPAANAAVSSALLHAMRILREAVDDAEVAVAWRLGDPSEWHSTTGRLSHDDSRRDSHDSHGSGITLPPPPLPPPLPPPTSPAPPAALAPAAAAWPGPLRSVLVVDDEPVNTALVARRLKREAPDVSVTVADDGADMVALTVAQRCRYDVVLMDQHMRGMNGDAAVAALRAHEAAAALPRSLVLACTGNVCEPDLARFESAGFDGYIRKPINMCALVPTLSALIRTSSGHGLGANVHMFDAAAGAAVGEGAVTPGGGAGGSGSDAAEAATGHE
jgi:CheY-like chemotaxis protein